MTIPQIEAVLARLNKHISLKIGIPMKDADAATDTADEEHTVEDALAFCSLFNRIG